MKKKVARWVWPVVFALALAGLYLMSRWGLLRAFYTPEWSARHFFWLAAAVIFLPVLYGKLRFSALALAGYVAGMAAGELLGGWERHVGPQYLHHGWWIMILTFLLFCAIGAAVQHRKRKPPAD